MPAPESGVPELAGLATYAEAARIGYSVDENVRRLLRYQWAVRRLMSSLLAHLPAEPVWEVKCAMALHQWQLAEHANAIRARIGEMRHPIPALDRAPDASLDRFLDEVQHSRGTAELIAGTYGVAIRALAESYRAHLAASNPLVDHPTRRVLRFALLELEEALAWSEAVPHRPDRVRRRCRGRGHRMAGAPAGFPGRGRRASQARPPRLHLRSPSRARRLPSGRISGPGETRASRACINSSFRRTCCTTTPGFPPMSATWRSSPSARSRWMCPK